MIAELDDLAALAVAVAGHTGRMLRDERGEWRRTERHAAHDVKLVGDRAAEAVATGLLCSGSRLPVFSEEGGWFGWQPSPESAEPSEAWVLDPLDGSANYARDVPLSVVSIAYCVGGTPLIGVVYDFWRDEMFCGYEGATATCNGAPMRVSDTSEVSRAILGTGFPAALDYDRETLDAYVRSAGSFHKVRSLGTAALMLAYVAAGRFDAYREHNVRFWDVAAGIALVRAAGGVVETGGVDSDQGFGRRLKVTADNGRIGVARS
ncbi:MAG: inositol monophosphatase family protein [Pseudomonadota bacterium]